MHGGGTGGGPEHFRFTSMMDLALRRRSALWHALAVLAILSGVAAAIARAEPPVVERSREIERADAEIAFWASRADRDPADYLTPTKLGVLLTRHARRTGDAALYARAERALTDALARNPSHQPASVALATVYIARHRFPEALATARKAAEADPDDPQARAVLGDAYLEAGDLAAAEAQYAKLAEGAPAGLFALARVANLRHAKGDVAGAIAAINEALAAGEASGAPADDLAWCRVQLGRFAFERGDWAAAESAYNAALELVPGGYSATDHLAELRAAQKRFDEAVSLYERVVAAVPRPEYFQTMGDVLAAAGRADEARGWHDKALRGYLAAAAAGDPHYYHHLAGFYVDVEKNGIEAVKWARRDVELRRTTATLDALAWALHAAGEFREAATTMDEALARGGANAHVLYHASLIYFRAGNPAKAKDCLDRAAAANPKFTEFHVHR